MLAPDATFGLSLAAASGSVDAIGLLKWAAIAGAINAQIKSADLKVGSVTVPITGAAGTTPAVGSGVLA